MNILLLLLLNTILGAYITIVIRNKMKNRLFLNLDGCLHVIIRLYRLDYEYWTARHNRGRCTSGGISGNRRNRQSAAKNIGRMAGRQWDEIMAAQDIGGGGAVVARHNRSQVAKRFVERPTEIRVLRADISIVFKNDIITEPGGSLRT